MLDVERWTLSVVRVSTRNSKFDTRHSSLLTRHSTLDSLPRPSRMLRDQWLRLGRGSGQRRQGPGIGRIPKCHANVAQKSTALGPENGCAGETPFKRRLIQIEQFDQSR